MSVDGQAITVQHVWMYFIKPITHFILLAICDPVCGFHKECTAPNNCTCVSGWDGYNCLSGINIFS